MPYDPMVNLDFFIAKLEALADGGVQSPLLKRTWKENNFINHICTANSNISFLEGWAALLVVKWTQKVNRTTLGESSTATIVLINESLRSKQKKRTSKPLLSYFSMCQSRAQSELHTSYKVCRDFLMKKIIVLHLLNDIGYWNF